jgi:hypothetical protein
MRADFYWLDLPGIRQLRSFMPQAKRQTGKNEFTIIPITEIV